MAQIARKDLNFFRSIKAQIIVSFVNDDKEISGTLELNYYDALNNRYAVILAEELFTGEGDIVSTLNYPVSIIAYIPVFHVEVQKIIYPPELSTEQIAYMCSNWTQFYFEADV